MIAVIDYKMGNIRSVSNALESVTDQKIKIVDNPKNLSDAQKIVLPGVGAFGEGIKNIKKLRLFDALLNEILIKKKPFLGICLGMQMLAKKSFEYGENEGLGIIDAKVEKFKLDTSKYKIPHVGWNNIKVKKDHMLFNGIKNDNNFYFTHSFYMMCENNNDIIATSHYGHEFVCAIKRENIFATQFHPEKSQSNGLKILKNFSIWKND